MKNKGKTIKSVEDVRTLIKPVLRKHKIKYSGLKAGVLLSKSAQERIPESSASKAEVCADFVIKKAGIFGSLARGEVKRGSDIDILVEIESDISLLDVIGIKQEIEEVLERKVDLVEYKTLKPLIKKRVLKEAVPVKIILEKDEGGGFVATVPSLPGCVSQGDTEKEALANIKDAVSLHTESLAAD